MHYSIWLYSLVSVFIVSTLSLIGLATFAIKKSLLDRLLTLLVSLSAGAMFGDVFIHLLPEITEKSGFTLQISLTFIAGILFSLIIEKLINWNHCHDHNCKGTNERAFTYMILYGDSVHNFIDGLVIGGSYIVSPAVGIASTLAVILHEIPHEVGDFGALLHGGFSRKKALVSNFISALTAVLGAVLALLAYYYMMQIEHYLLAFAAANFIYIAGTDLIPELHKESNTKKAVLQIVFFVFGVALMLPLLLLEK